MARQTISQMIEDDLKKKITRGEPLPDFSLRALSRHYSVSEMPVRTAVDALVEQKFLDRGENGRLSVGADYEAVEGADADEVEPDEALAIGWDGKEMREDIIRLSLKGKGQYLREGAAAEKYGVGRTVIRRVLSQLSGEGLVSHEPRRGWWVLEFDEQDLVQYLQIREVLELKAIELSFPLMNPTDLDVFMQEANTIHEGGESDVDRRLHAYWIDLCGNGYIIHFFQNHGRYYAALLKHATYAESYVRRMAGQHKRIISELLNENLRGAQQALSEHIQAQHPILQRAIQKLQDGSGDT